jgi:integrase
VDAFEAWARPRYQRFDHSAESIDKVLAEYVAELFRTGQPKGQAVNAVAGLAALRPELRLKLPAASARLNAWRTIEPAQQHPPLTLKLAAAIAYRLACTGQFGAAAATIVAFDSLMRISEFTTVRAIDVLDTREIDIDGVMTPQFVVHLPISKTGTHQTAFVTHPYAMALLSDLHRRITLAHTERQHIRAQLSGIRKRAPGAAQLSAGLRHRLEQLAGVPAPDESMFGVTATRYRDLFKRTVRELGLSERYVPHSLRHGGATYMFMCGMDVATIAERGRWRQLQTVSRYLQTGQALLTTFEASHDVKELGARAWRHGPETLMVPVAFDFAFNVVRQPARPPRRRGARRTFDPNDPSGSAADGSDTPAAHRQ